MCGLRNYVLFCVIDKWIRGWCEYFEIMISLKREIYWWLLLDWKGEEKGKSVNIILNLVELYLFYGDIFLFFCDV